MNNSDQLNLYYRRTPWLSVLRFLEVEQFKMIRDLCSPPVLDLGCGDGFIAKKAFEQEICAGIDIKLNSLKTAQSNGTYRMVANADATHLPLNNSSFRTVYSNGAIEHMKDLNVVLSEIARILMPGGVFVALVPSDKFLKPVGKFSKLLGSKVWDTFNNLHNHVNLFSPEEWRRCMTANRFTVIRIEQYGATKIAELVSVYDLCSKFHFVPRWPFFQLRHNGNLGRLVLRLNLHPRHFFMKMEQVDSSLAGYWLMILAISN
jgi:SAM-dependent methyltransferase